MSLSPTTEFIAKLVRHMTLSCPIFHDLNKKSDHLNGKSAYHMSVCHHLLDDLPDGHVNNEITR